MDADIRRRLDEGLLCVEQAVIVDRVLVELREWAGCIRGGLLLFRRRGIGLWCRWI